MGDNNFLQQNWPCLVKNLRSPLIHGILDEMFSELNLSQDEYDHVYSCKETDCDKARRLLQLVSSRGEPALRVFKETLKEHNPELYESLGETDGDDSLPGTLEKALFSSGHDSDDSGSSGVECGSPASLGTPSDEEEDGRSAEPLRVTVGAVNEMMEELEKKGTELRLKSRMRQAKQTFNDLAQLADLCAKQEEGEVGFQIKYLKRKSVLEAFQSSYDQGTLGEEVQEQFAKLVEENPDILKVETDVKVVWKEEQNKNRDKEQAKGYDGIIKVSAKELKLADDYVLEVGSQGAFESLCDYLVENPDELDQIITYLNKIKVQVYDITRGCIELQFGCLTGESAVCLQEEDSSGRLSTQFQELMSPFLKQFGLKSLVLDVRCTFSQDTKAETSPEQIAAAQPAVFPLTVAQTTSYTATYKAPATDSLQTDTASPGISEDSMMQEECFASDTTLSKVSNTKGLDHATSVDNLMALPPPIRKVDHFSLRSLDLAMVGGKDLSCTDAAYNASTLNFTVREVQTALQKRSKKVQQQQNDALKTAREDTEAMVRSMSMEIKRLTQKEEEAQKVLLEQKQETQQVKETNKTYEANIEELTAKIRKLSNKIPNLQDEVKSVSEKDKTSQKVLSEKNLEIQQLQETSKTKEAEIEKLNVEITKLSNQLLNLQHEVKSLSKKDNKTSQMVLLENKDMADKMEELLSVEHLAEGEHQEGEEKGDLGTLDINIAPCGVTENTITITWTETVGTVDNYIISIDDNPAASVDDGAPLEYAFTGLTPGTQYNISVTTVSSGVKRMAATRALRTKPAKPRHMRIKEVRKTSMTITWAGPEGITDSYRVRISSVDGDTIIQAKLIKCDNANHYTLTNLTPGTEYNIGVRAVSGQLTSQELIILQRTKPAKPRYMHIEDVRETCMTVTWERAEGYADSYRVRISPVDGDTIIKEKLIEGGDTNHYTLTDLTPGTEYNIGVRAVSGQLMSEELIKLQRTMATPMESEEGDTQPINNELSPRNKLYMKISESLSESEVESLRMLMITDNLIARGRVQNANPHEIFNMLEANGKMGAGNLGLLKELLRELKKGRLAEEAEDVEKMEVGDLASSAEDITDCSKITTVGDVYKRIDVLRTKIAKLTRYPKSISQAKTMAYLKAAKELDYLMQLLSEQGTGELRVDIALVDTDIQEFQKRYETGTLSQEIQKEVKQIMRSTCDDIVNVKPDVRVDFSQSTAESTNCSPAQRATIKVTAEDVQLEDSCRLDKDSAVRQLFKYLVENPKKLHPIMKYLNSFHVQVRSISYGSIDVECICLTSESAVRLQEENDGRRLHAQFQRMISSLTILIEFGIKSISLKLHLRFADEGPSTQSLHLEYPGNDQPPGEHSGLELAIPVQTEGSKDVLVTNLGKLPIAAHKQDPKAIWTCGRVQMSTWKKWMVRLNCREQRSGEIPLL